MDFIIKPHAKKRMSERAVTVRMVREALEYPTKIGYDSKGRMLIRRVYQKAGTDRPLLIVCEEHAEILEIITVIDTSKVAKYL